MPGTWVFIIIILTVLASSSSGEEDSVQILDILRAADAEELPTFTLRVRLEEMASPFPDQGTSVKTCTISRRAADEVAVACATERLPKPVYQPLGTANYNRYDYDFDGNLVIWMHVEEFALWSKERNERYFEVQSFFVSPQGVVVMSGEGRALDRYPVTDAWTPPIRMQMVWWALGQGIAPDLHRLEDECSDEDGRKWLRVRGTRKRGSLEGEWNIVVEPSAGNLIRLGTFQYDIPNYTRFEVRTTGLRWFGTLALPEEGLLRLRFGQTCSDLPKKVVLEEFSFEADEELFEQVRKTLDNAASRGELTVYDYRDNPSRPIVAHERP
jgi:hypothetical protein